MTRSRQSLFRAVMLAPVVLMLAALTISGTGCTAVGYGIGTLLTKNERPRRVPAGQGLRVEPGTPMELVLSDTALVRGVYLGRARIDAETYAAHYEAWRVRTPGAPVLEGEIELRLTSDRTRHVTFHGFTYRALSISEPGSNVRRDLPFSRVRTLITDRAPGWSGNELAEMDARGELPSLEALRVGVGLPFSWTQRWRPEQGIAASTWPSFDDTVLVATDHVRTLTLPARHGLRTVCTLAGFAVDVTVVALIAAVASMEPMFGGSGCSSVDIGYTRWAPEPTDRPFDRIGGAWEEPALAQVPPSAGDSGAGPAPRPDALDAATDPEPTRVAP